jgi:cobyrinic acid a,c-diamide synthase
MNGTARALPRIFVAGVSSGVGKTTTTVALCGALRRRGLRVAAFKCGPDYLDPTYLARATDRPVQNVDGWMMGRDAVIATVEAAARDADIAVFEGVMGLHDGASPTGAEGSTAELSRWLEAPVLLTIDAGGMARSVAALARGFAAFDRGVNLAGVVCNRVGSRGHLDLLRQALGEPPLVGGFPVAKELAFPERHLGLRTADRAAIGDEQFAAWAGRAEEWLDLDAILAIARAAPPLPLPGGDAGLEARPAAGPTVAAARCRIGIARDAAFHFYYEDNLRRLERLGAVLVPFSPIADAALPAVDGLYLGGGYPEIHAAALSENRTMRGAIAAFAAAGGPIYAECGGLMYLAAAIRTLDGARHEMVGLVPGEAVMSPRLEALGYVEVETQAGSILGPAGLRFRGHQFRYSSLRLEEAAAPAIETIYRVRRRRGGEVTAEGYRRGSLLASYVHAHWASNPAVAEGLVDACAAAARSRA